MSTKYALVLPSLDNIILNNYWRKFYTYKEIGWDEASIQDYLLKKENIMKIASFTTIEVSFSASSRRNRYYEIYDRPDMLGQDVPFEGAREAIQRISKVYDIHVLSTRQLELKEETLQVLSKLGFDLSLLTIHFKKSTDKLDQYKRATMKQIAAQYPSGIGICENYSDIAIYDWFKYPSVIFTSVKEPDHFESNRQKEREEDEKNSNEFDDLNIEGLGNLAYFDKDPLPDKPFIYCHTWLDILSSLNIP